MNHACELRERRESLGLTLLDLARTARCPAETVLHAEFGMELPRDLRLRGRLAEAYSLSRQHYDRMVVDAARRFRDRTRSPTLC
jgi:transcriptional regulator with XRE-family HTH domain